MRRYPLWKDHYKFSKERAIYLSKHVKNNVVHQPLGDSKIEKLGDSYFIIIDKWDDNIELNSITDFFTEKARIKCVFKGNTSALDYWRKHREQLVQKTAKVYKVVNIVNLRETLYSEIRLCNNFRVSVMLRLLEHFQPKKYLDISAGWGDRLIASILYGVEFYYSADPNHDLHKRYKKIIKALAPKDKQDNYIIKEDGFENISIPYTDFDVVISSPPFFDLEVYSNYDNDSLKSYPDKESWNRDFLMKCITKCYDHLRVGGYLVLYYNHEVKDLHKLMRYQGQMYFYDTRYRGLYVWKKTK